MACGGFHCRAQPERHQLHFPRGMGITIPPFMFPLKCFLQIPCERQVEFVSLTAVTDVDAWLIVNSPLPCFFLKNLRGLFLQSSKFSIQFRRWEFTSNPPQHRAPIILDHVPHQKPESREPT